jgi:hypothetical protein
MAIIKNMTSNRAEGPSWSERSRLEFIELVLYWRGWINRRDLVRKFGLSLPQATNDLVTYATLSEGGCVYNNRKRRYETAPSFHPRLILPRLWEDLQMLSRVVWSAEGTPLLAVPELPVRQASPGVAQQISRAIFSS